MKLKSDLGNDSINKLVFNLAVPSMIAQLVNVLYSIVDRMFIGHIEGVGQLALAGVGVCGPIVTFLSSFGTLIGLGGSIYMAMRMGENENEKAREILSNSFLLLVVFSALLTFTFLFLKDKLIMWFGASVQTYPFANTYLTIYTVGCFFAIMAVGLNYFITCQGFPTIGMMTVIIGALSNIILDAVFIFIFNMGVSGAAIATVIAQVISFLFAFCFLLSKKVTIKLCITKKCSKKVMIRILKGGLTPFLIIAMDSFIIIIMNSMLARFGNSQADMLISVSTIVQSYLLLITGPLLGLSGGTQALLSYNYGAQNIIRIKKAEKTITLWAVVFTSIMFIISQFFGRYFIVFFTENKELIELSNWGIRVSTLGIIPLSIQYIVVDGLTALTKIKQALFLSLFRKSIYIAVTIIFPIVFYAKYAFLAEPIADIFICFFSIPIFIKVLKNDLHKQC